MNQTKYSKIGLVVCTIIPAILTGCYVDGPRHAQMYAPPPVYVDGGAVMQDDYVYYPDYQVYYSSNRRQYVYLDGGSWVTRDSPPRVSVGVFFASPSVRLNFHDSPWLHHASVARQYPQHSIAPKPGRGDRDRRQGEPEPR
jgi:hypothetical protein